MGCSMTRWRIEGRSFVIDLELGMFSERNKH